jgi:hypothetical protein
LWGGGGGRLRGAAWTTPPARANRGGSADDRLVLVVRGVEGPTLSEEERQLCRAIIGAVVDEAAFEPGVVRLVKGLSPADQ